nr:MAG TPA: dsDNA helicase [Caudoviricetes sp.]
MDFFNIKTKENKDGTVTVYPNFIVGRSRDLMVKGRSFFAIWDEQTGLWSTDEYDVQRLVDKELEEFVQDHEGAFVVKYMRNFDSDIWPTFRKFVSNISDNAKTLDNELIFSNKKTVKEDYATKKLPYPLEAGDHSAWDQLLETLYSQEERTKIEWAIGSIVSGDSRYIQKFMVLYGPSGTGKSTILNIIQKLFEGYIVMFDAKALGSNGNAFATEVFKSNPLVAIQHDGDLSRIEDNTKLNSIISHEDMLVNEKYKPSYSTRINAFLFMGTNLPVKISDAKSGLIRRLIDVEPTGKTLPSDVYTSLMEKIKFEYGAIAKHCLDLYLDLGEHYYDDYKPLSMMYKTDHVLNFVSDNYSLFSTQEYTTSKQAYSLYKEYVDESGVERPLSRQKLQAELGNYFEEFHERYTSIDGKSIRSVFTNFDIDKVKAARFNPDKKPSKPKLVLDETTSIFDKEYSDAPAQLCKADGTPKYRWKNVKTKLSDVDTSKLHYVQVPENHIVIDFDLKNEDGEKDLELNLEAAANWPATYSEVSKSGKGVHLHYIYDGDVSRLANVYEDDIEIKVYTGDSSLRRQLSVCKNAPFAHISSGLPLKEKKVQTVDKIQSEKGLRTLIVRNLRKEIHPGTKPSVEFIRKILDDAYESDLVYDVTDMRNDILSFASKSTHHSLDMIKEVQKMKFKSENADDGGSLEVDPDNKAIAFFDLEVYPNLFVVCWKYEDEENIITMINPTPQEVEELFRLRLVGFNNRRYDNHILYARYHGYTNEALYQMSQRIINNDRDALFGGAYGISYADIYDFSSKKQSLKKFEIELGINHMEMDIPWDEPVPEDLLPKVVEYCKNDVLATEAVFKARRADFEARQILAELSGLSVNDTTQRHTAKIIFGDDKKASEQFVYTDLSEMFPGYKFDRGKSSYRDVDVVGEGGYVYSEPGLYKDVAVLDVASMHPTSIENLNLFGKYTKNFSDLKKARIAIKHGDYEHARKMLDGKLAPYLKDESDAADLSYALKIVINIVYGLTSAKFPNAFRDNRNKDNIVAKRGALFMIDLRHFVKEKGFDVVHIKTDSIKIPGATQEIIDEVIEFGKEYGYDFEHEATYDAMCLVNDAVYIAREGDKWDAVGAQFQHPYVFKKLFTHEDIDFNDYVETRQVTKGSIFIDYAGSDEPKAHVGRIGRFVPVVEGTEGAGTLLRVQDEKEYALAGTKGHLWAREEVAKQVGPDCIDRSYAEGLADEAVKAIEQYGNLEDLF